MFKFFVFLLGIFVYSHSYSQSNFIPGSIIKSNKDTLYCLIDYQYLNLNHFEVSFKVNPNNSPTILRPEEVLEYRVNSDIFVSGIVKTFSDEAESTENVFLQVLIKSKKSLYYFKNKLGEEFFFIKQTGKFVLLENRSENKEYINQLSSYLADCPNIDKLLKRTRYTKYSLIKLFDTYALNTRTFTFYRHTNIPKVEYGILAGTSLTTLDFSDAKYNFLFLMDTTNFCKSYNFSGGVFLNVLLPWNKWRFSIVNELLYSSYKSRGSIKVINTPTDYVIFTNEVALNYIKLNNMLRYKYSIGQTSIFINTGISNGYAYKRSVVENRVDYDGTDIYHSKSTPFHRVRSYELGFIIGVGVKHRSVSIEARYEKGNGMEDQSAIKTNINRYFLLLGYTF